MPFMLRLPMSLSLFRVYALKCRALCLSREQDIPRIVLVVENMPHMNASLERSGRDHATHMRIPVALFNSAFDAHDYSAIKP